jgi:hypothetical protein
MIRPDLIVPLGRGDTVVVGRESVLIGNRERATLVFVSRAIVARPPPFYFYSRGGDA